MSPRDPSLLVVDDELPFLDLLKTYFKQRGFDTVCAETSTEALDLMNLRPFDVIILDYQMPHIKGADLIGKLQHIHPQARFIIVTGSTEAEIEEKFKGLGYYAFVLKGTLSLERLEVLVRRAFSA